MALGVSGPRTTQHIATAFTRCVTPCSCAKAPSTSFRSFTRSPGGAARVSVSLSPWSCWAYHNSSWAWSSAESGIPRVARSCNSRPVWSLTISFHFTALRRTSQCLECRSECDSVVRQLCREGSEATLVQIQSPRLRVTSDPVVGCECDRRRDLNFCWGWLFAALSRCPIDCGQSIRLSSSSTLGESMTDGAGRHLSRGGRLRLHSREKSDLSRAHETNRGPVLEISTHPTRSSFV